MNVFMSITLWTYLAVLLTWLIGRAFIGDGSTLVLGLNYLGVWLFSPLLVYIPWVMFGRQKAAAVLLVIPVFLFLWFYGNLFDPRRVRTENPRDSFSVVTYNTKCSNADGIAFGEFLDDSQPDILALQEVVSLEKNNLGQFLEDRFAYQTYYAPAGLAIYSKHPILSQEIIPAQPWSIQGVVIKVNNQPVMVINAHLAKPGILLFLETRDLDSVRNLTTNRINQISIINQAISESMIPAIVTCDCNMTDLTSTYKQMTINLKDAFKEKGWGLGHTFLIPRGFEINSKINLPFQRIDYIFHSPNIRVNNVQVVSKDSGSDHRPVWVHFDIQP